MINVIKKMKNIGMYAFLILVTFISVFPLYWMVSASTNKSVDVSRGVLSFGSHLGENLKNLLANQDVGAALVNSFKYAILLTIVSMVICSLAGYGFEIYHDKAKDAVMVVFIPTMKSTYAAAMTITFMNAWNSYMWPKVIMTQSKSMTMPMVVANLTEGYVTDYGMLMLAVLICTLPTALVFFILQKNFAEGITGAVK